MIPNAWPVLILVLAVAVCAWQGTSRSTMGLAPSSALIIVSNAHHRLHALNAMTTISWQEHLNARNVLRLRLVYPVWLQIQDYVQSAIQGFSWIMVIAILARLSVKIVLRTAHAASFKILKDMRLLIWTMAVAGWQVVILAVWLVQLSK